VCAGLQDIATREERAIVVAWTPFAAITAVAGLGGDHIEGSPTSPPFATPEMLARWCVENPFGADDASYEDSPRRRSW